MQYSSEQLQSTAKHLLDLYSQLHKKLKRNANNHSDLRLRVIKNHNSFQYYTLHQGESGNGTYLPRKHENKAAAIIQMDYENDILKQLETQIKNLRHFLHFHMPGAINQAYSNLPEGRKRLVKPIALLDDEYAKQWESLSYTGKPFSDDHPDFFTTNGLRVRSKSEIIIANALSQEGVPFRYEFPLEIKRNMQPVTLHPDFICLNKKTRKEFIWEHFGLIGDPNYEHNVVQKLALYSANGYILGKNLIATFEDDKTALSTKQVMNYIKSFLLK